MFIVYGASSALGLEFVKECANRGTSVVVIGRNSTKDHILFADSGVRVVYETDELLDLPACTLVNFAYIGAAKSPNTMREIFAQLERIKAFANLNAVKVVVHASSISTYGRHPSPRHYGRPASYFRATDFYSFSKIIQERQISKGVKKQIRILRLGNILGDGMLWENFLRRTSRFGIVISDAELNSYTNTVHFKHVIQEIFSISAAAHDSPKRSVEYRNVVESTRSKWVDLFKDYNVPIFLTAPPNRRRIRRLYELVKFGPALPFVMFFAYRLPPLRPLLAHLDRMSRIKGPRNTSNFGQVMRSTAVSDLFKDIQID